MRAFDALRERPFRAFYLARATSVFGDGLLPVALAFGVLQTEDSATALGIVLAFRFISLVGLMPISGAIADRMPRRLVLVLSDGLRFCVQGVTAALLVTHVATIWELAGLTFLYGVGDAFFLPTATGIMPETVSPGHLQQANALVAMTQSACTVIGPAIAGVIVVATSPGWAFAVDALTFAASAAFIFRLPRRSFEANPQGSRAATGGTSFLDEIRVGWRAFSQRRWLRVEVVYGALAAFAVFGSFETLGPLVAKNMLGGAGAWSAIMVAFGVGAVVGGVALTRVSPARPLVASILALSVIALAPAALAVPAPAVAVGAGAFCAGFGLAFYSTLIETTIQRAVPPDMLSRVASIDYMLSNALFPAGAALAGPLAAIVGSRVVFVAAAGWMLASSAAVLGLRSVRTFRVATSEENDVHQSAPSLQSVEAETPCNS
ncbi:MAG: MFS transporter [Acidimicrobiales bacterium]